MALVRTEAQCANPKCGKTFIVNSPRQKCCCPACTRETNKVEKICEQCGATFRTIRRITVGRHKQLYCSNTCYGIAKTGKTLPRPKRAYRSKDQERVYRRGYNEITIKSRPPKRVEALVSTRGLMDWTAEQIVKNWTRITIADRRTA